MWVARHDPSGDKDPVQCAHIQDFLSRRVRSCNQLEGPIIVSDSIHDHEVRARNRRGIRSVRLVLVRVRVGIAHNAEDRGEVPAQLADQTTPEILARDDLDGLAHGDLTDRTVGACRSLGEVRR